MVVLVVVVRLQSAAIHSIAHSSVFDSPIVPHPGV
jgi:hypothetical protein